MAPVALCPDLLRPFRREMLAAALLLLVPCLPLLCQAPWSPVGPAGGDARSFAAVPSDPRHLYMGSTDSWIYESVDGGASWQRLSRLGASDDLVVDHILVDPRDPSTLFAAAWQLGSNGGGLWISHDGGHTFAEAEALRGQSIRALAQAHSDPGILVAGSLEGVFRSTDSGATWQLITPPGSHELHEIESVAIDPANPEIVYAGTWHLPWKTTDGGRNWANIKNGVIDDSDVFSIVVDPLQPATVYASACSGIYKSLNAGALFKKIQGIPSTARRTRILKQDPKNREIVYAGTTEGLYKTLDGGRSFARVTGPEVIVNDVFVSPANPNHVLLATDRGGVLLSEDAGATFVAANRGFSGRKVEALLADRADPARLYAGVVNDKAYGGVFASSDGGGHWEQLQRGLDARDVYTLAQSAEGLLLAGTSDGIFALQPSGPAAGWQPRNTVQNTVVLTSTVAVKGGKKASVEKRVPASPHQLAGRVYALDPSGSVWLASTVEGLFTSRDKGATWQGGFVNGQGDYLSAAAHGEQLVAVREQSLVFSADAGASWHFKPVPNMITRIHRVAFSADGTLWLGAREGAFLTRDLGKTWLWIERLPFRNITDLYYDSAKDRILATSRESDFIYAIDPAKLTWKWWQTGYRVNLVRAAQGRLLAASLFDGVLIEPETAVAAPGQQ